VAVTHARRTTAIIVILLAVTALPYLYARITTPADLVYTGLMFDVPDHAQYWSWTTASRDGLFISNTMTPEPNDRTFMNPMMWLLAQAQNVFGVSFPVLFQWWRLLAIIIVVPGLVAFVRVMVPEPDRRSTALAVALMGSGFGCLQIVAKRILGTGDVPWPTDLYTVEPNTFFSLLAYPHIALAQGLILGTMVGAWLAYQGRGWKAWVVSGIAAALLSMSHAYDLITVYGVLGVFGLVTWIRDRRFPMRLAAVGLFLAACSGPVALYYQRLTAADPLWRAVLSQYPNAGVWTPPHWHLIVLMGLPLLLAVYGAVRPAAWTAERRFLSTWAAVTLVLIYLPVVYQIKLLSGWQFPIAVLAAHAWHERIREWFLPRVSPRLATAGLVLIVASTNMYLLAWRFVELRRHTAPYYLHQDQLDALDWLAHHTEPSDVVLAPLDFGQFVPNYGGSRAYLAHWAMTNRFFERRDNVDAFFRVDTSDSWRHDLLARERVTLVVRTDWPDTIGEAFDPTVSSRFETVFVRPRAQVYRFLPSEPSRFASRPVEQR
jgi:hypothetical protein